MKKYTYYLFIIFINYIQNTIFTTNILCIGNHYNLDNNKYSGLMSHLKEYLKMYHTIWLDYPVYNIMHGMDACFQAVQHLTGFFFTLYLAYSMIVRGSLETNVKTLHSN